MKAFIALSLSAAIILGGFALSERRQSKLLAQQIEDYARQNSQLLTQIESNSLRNVKSAEALRALQSELIDRDNQITALSRQLESTRQQVDPDYSQVEAQLRQQLRREIQANDTSANFNPSVSVFRQLSELDPMAVGEIFALNAQYGEFIKGLDADDERMDVVVTALQNLIADQNQARSDIIQELQTNPKAAIRDDLRQRMEAVSSTEAQLEALAYDLTEAELNAFEEFQKQRQSAFASLRRIEGTANGPFNGPLFLGTDVIRGEPGQSRAVQILPVNPQ